MNCSLFFFYIWYSTVLKGNCSGLYLLVLCATPITSKPLCLSTLCQPAFILTKFCLPALFSTLCQPTLIMYNLYKTALILFTCCVIQLLFCLYSESELEKKTIFLWTSKFGNLWALKFVSSEILEIQIWRKKCVNYDKF